MSRIRSSTCQPSRSWHPEVEDHDVGMALVELAHAVSALDGLCDRGALTFEQGPEELAESAFILDDQHGDMTVSHQVATVLGKCAPRVYKDTHHEMETSCSSRERGARPTTGRPRIGVGSRGPVVGATRRLQDSCTRNDDICCMPRPDDADGRQLERERKVRRLGSFGSPRIAPTHGLRRPAHPSLLLVPAVSPSENPFPFTGLSRGRPPPNDHHRARLLY